MPENHVSSEPNRELTSLLSKLLNAFDFVRYVVEVRELKVTNGHKPSAAQPRGLILAVVSPRDYLSQHETALFIMQR
jgi:hypothetical protein